MTLTMADSVTPANLPGGYDAYAGYVDGRWPDYAAIASAEAVPCVSIAVFASDDAECLDVETGDASPNQAPGWVLRQMGRGIVRPIVYADLSTMPLVIQALTSLGIALSKVRLWTAHYTYSPHVCGTACGLPVTADATQWTDKAAGVGGTLIDASELVDGFFGTAAAVPATTWQEEMMRQLPELGQGTTGNDVRSVQALCNARLSSQIAIDGVFGPITNSAVRTVQSGAHITVDGIVGPQTWPALLGV